MEQFCKNCETQLHSSEPDVIQDIHPHFIRVSFLRRILLYAGGRQSRPPAPPQAFSTKNVEKRSQANE